MKKIQRRREYALPEDQYDCVQHIGTVDSAQGDEADFVIIRSVNDLCLAIVLVVEFITKFSLVS